MKATIKKTTLIKYVGNYRNFWKTSNEKYLNIAKKIGFELETQTLGIFNWLDFSDLIGVFTRKRHNFRITKIIKILELIGIEIVEE